MQTPIQITVRDIPHTNALITQIREKADKLEQFCNNIISCRVVLTMPKNHMHQGKEFNVRIDIQVPKEEVVINRSYHDNVHIAVRDAFLAARRKLQAHNQKIRGHVKTHNSPSEEINKTFEE